MGKLSIVVPAYKVAAYIEDCLKSMTQTPDISIIAVDDGSPDDSGAICDRVAAADPRVRVLHQKNGGVSAARNAGLALCESQWVWFVDGDDMIEPDAVAKLTAAFDCGADMIAFRHRRSTQPREAGTGALRELSEEELGELRAQNVYARRDSKLKGIVVNSAAFVCFRTEFLRENGLCFEVGLRKGQDTLFTANCLARCRRLCYLDESLYIYRINDGSVSRRYTKNISSTILQVLERYRRLVETCYPQNEEMYSRLLCRCMWMSRSCLGLEFSHTDNPEPYRARRQAFMDYMARVQPAFADISLLHESAAGRLLYGAIKRRRFLLLNLLYRENTRREKGRYKR